ncbi:MAG: lactoylglutathione lyase [Pseudomonadales bacterium]
MTSEQNLEGVDPNVPETGGFVMNQTMLRIRDPERSLAFYREVLGMTLLKRLDFPEMTFSLYFVGYLRPSDGELPADPRARTAFTFRQPALIELTHNWGTEDDADFAGYHNGNQAPQGFGHIGLSVPDVRAACERFDALGVEFQKRPDDGRMKGIAFIRDPDGYWIEILQADAMAELTGGA